MKLENKYKTVIWILVVFMVLNSTAIITLLYKKQSLNYPVNERYFKGRSFHHVLDEIGFTAEQKEKAYQMRNKHFINNRAIFEKLHKQRQLLLKELSKEEPDTQKIDRTAREIGNLHYNLKKETIRHFYDMRKLCTPDQRDEFFTIMTDISEEFQRPFHHERRGHNREQNNDSSKFEPGRKHHQRR